MWLTPSSYRQRPGTGCPFTVPVSDSLKRAPILTPRAPTLEECLPWPALGLSCFFWQVCLKCSWILSKGTHISRHARCLQSVEGFHLDLATFVLNGTTWWRSIHALRCIRFPDFHSFPLPPAQMHEHELWWSILSVSHCKQTCSVSNESHLSRKVTAGAPRWSWWRVGTSCGCLCSL